MASCLEEIACQHEDLCTSEGLKKALLVRKLIKILIIFAFYFRFKPEVGRFLLLPERIMF